MKKHRKLFLKKTISGLMLGFVAAVLFLATGMMQTANAQNTVNMEGKSQPSPIVVSGEPVTFEVEITNTTASPISEGYKLKVFFSSANWYINSATVLSIVRPIDRNGDTVTFTLPTIGVSGTITVNISVSPKCGIIGVADHIYYTVYDANGQRKSVLNYDPYNLGIGNIVEPLLNLTLQSSLMTYLNVDAFRIHNITQTQTGAYARQIKVEQVVDDNTVQLVKLEVSKDNSGWIQVVDSLITHVSGKYIYNFNALLLAQLGYVNNHFNKDDKIYFRETVRLTNCTGNSGSVYTTYYGANGTFCTTTIEGTATITAPVASFSGDVRTINYIYPNRDGRTEGRTQLRLLNTSTDDGAVMRDIRAPVFHTLEHNGKSGYNFYKNTVAYLIYPTGVNVGKPLAGPGGENDTIFIPMYSNHGFATTNGTIASNANTYVVVLDSLKTAANAKIAYAITQYGENVVGLCDFDGDGIYNDLKAGKEVGIAVRHVNNMNIHSPCEAQFRESTIRIAYLAWKNSCNQYQMFNQTYMTDAANQTSQVWIGRMYYPALINVQTIPSEITPDASVILKVSRGVSGGTNNTGEFILSNDYYEHFEEITLPVGFEFEWPLSTGDIEINTSGTTTHSVNAADIISYDPISRIIRFKYNNYANLKEDGHNFYIKVKVLPTIAPATSTNTANIKHIFRYGDAPETEYSYSCYSKAATYNILELCSDFGFDKWSLDRASFGYKSLTDRTPMTSEAIAAESKNIAFQRDNVDLTAKGCALANIKQDDNKQLIATFSYTGGSGAANRYFDVLNAKVGVKQGANDYVYYDVLIADNTYDYTVPSLHSIKINCQIAGELQTADSIILTVHMRIKDDVPTVTNPVPNMSMQWGVVTDGTPSTCNKFAKTDFYIKNTNYSELYHNGNSVTYNIGNGIKSELLFYTSRIEGDVGSSDMTITGRNNFQVISDSMVIRLNGLYKITGLENRWFSPTVVLKEENGDYAVDYAADQTIITILKPKDVNDGYSSFGWRHSPFYFSAKHIWYSGGLGVSLAMRILDGPTSAEPKEKNIGKSTSLSRSVFNYQYNLTTNQMLSEPLTDRAEWPLFVSNQTSWGSSYVNDTLHHSWIAIEDASQTLYEPKLYYEETDETFLPEEYASPDGSKTYYWFKLGNLSASSERFILSAGYTSCLSRVDFIAKYSCGRGDYPKDPTQGFAQYNSSKKNPEKELTLSLLPPQGALSGALEVSTTPVTPPNSYDICEKICYTATMRSGMNASLYKPKVIVRKANGMAWNGILAEVTATYDDIAVQGDISVVETTDSLIFTLPNTVEIGGVSSDGKDLKLNFCLLMGDGFIANTPTYAYLTAETGCGQQYSILVNSNNIKIDGFASSMPIFNMFDFQASDLTYSANGEGTMILTGIYTIIANPSTGTSSFITLPDNLRLVSGTLSSGSYSANYTTTKDRHVIKAPYSDDPGMLHPGIEYNVNLTLQATSPGNWSCRKDSIHSSSGISQLFACSGGSFTISQMSDISTVQEFEVKKVELAFDPSGTTIEGEYYSSTQERITATVQLINNSAIPSGAVKVELFLDNDGDGTFSFGDGPVIGNPFIGIANIGGYDVASVSRTFIINSTDICKLMFVIRQDNNP
jgi:hypothetical protein